LDLNRPVRPIPDRPNPSIHHEWRTFSLWCPAPLQRLYRWLHLADDALELANRRIFVVAAVTWLPLFVLSAVSRLVRTGAPVPFLLDFDVQARFLVALPLLVIGEVVVHRRMPIVVRQFVERRIVVGEARVAFDQAVSSALSLSRSMIAELLLLACVYTVGFSMPASTASLPGPTWYGQASDGSMILTPAGWWYLAVSRPLFQFMLLRWYYRFFIWSRFLWQVSRLRLHLVPTHPDRRGGLGFVFGLNDAFAPFLLAEGTMVAGHVGNSVIHAGLTLGQSQLELIAVPVAAVLLVLCPEFVFTPTLWRTKRKGLNQYGTLAQQYVREFDHKWLHRHGPVAEGLLGSADIQSLADLAGSFEIVQQMRLLPTRQTILTLALFAVVPLAPLPFTMVSGRELLERLAKMVL
jgi:hypothetical protein